MVTAELIKKFIAAKKKEDAAILARRILSEEIGAQLEHPDDGSATHTFDGYKVTVKGVLNRKVDWDAFDKVRTKFPPVKMKPSLDLKGLTWLQDNDPDVYAEYAQTAITTKAGAVSVTVKETK